MTNNFTLQEDLHQAIKTKDTYRKTALRLLIATIQLAEVAKGSTLTEQELMAIIQKEIKTKQDTIHDAEQAGRVDLITQAKAEISILNEYLPKQLSYSEILQLAGEIIAELNATTMKDMGNVMKVMIERLNGQASNQDASKAIRDLLRK